MTRTDNHLTHAEGVVKAMMFLGQQSRGMLLDKFDAQIVKGFVVNRNATLSQQIFNAF